jgi:hypothetical protein
VIEGGVHASASWEIVELRRTIELVREAVAGLGLPASTREAVEQALDAAAREASLPKPDKHDVAEQLGKVTRTLEEAGALVGGGILVVAALRRAAVLLGPVGEALIGTV